MKLIDVINHANDVADESESNMTVTNFVNDAIAKVNAECKANFPFMSVDLLDADLPIPETYVRVMVVPFVVGRIKTKDSSQFEYSDQYNEFLSGLQTFQSNYPIPEALKDRSGQVQDPVTGEWLTTTSDIYTVRPYGWSGW